MPLTPEEIRQHRFGSTAYGYRRADVRGFLSRIASDYEHALAAIAEAADYPPSARDIDAMLRGVQESCDGLRRAAALVALGRESEAEPLQERAAEVMERAANLLERARDAVVRAASPGDAPESSGPSGFVADISPVA